VGSGVNVQKSAPPLEYPLVTICTIFFTITDTRSILHQFCESIYCRNRQLAVKLYKKLVMTIELERQTLPHLEVSDSSTMFLHRNIHTYTWTSPDGKLHNQIDHSLIDRRRHSSVLDVRSFRAADCDTDHCLVWQQLGRDWQ
jgi:hypothetical protein